MSTMQTRVAGWPLRIVTEDGNSVGRFVPEAGELPQRLQVIYVNDHALLRLVGDGIGWLESGVPQFIQPHTKRALRLAIMHKRERLSQPLPLPQVTKPEPGVEQALWFRGCRIAKIEGYSEGCVEVELITQGGERSVDCVPMSEVTIRSFRK